MSYEGAERRRHERLPVTARVTVLDGDQSVYLFTRDLSMGGAGLFADNLYPLGSKLYLEFSIEGVKRLVKARGEIVRHFQTPEPGFGVRFSNFLPYSRARLEGALQKLGGPGARDPAKRIETGAAPDKAVKKTDDNR